ncbi:5'-3'-deoxyribonucleotidase [Bacillus salitolerans]|uniref:5'-3'-deoxyribonucleotidase n=1 Tax=Bacillus salitolerans TaxID=1437434 RepID=A0ABW4LSE0_9BACI
MKKIAIDMDEVMADFLTKHLDLYNQSFNDNLTVQDLNGVRLWHLRSEKYNEIIDLVNEPSFFRDLGVMEDSQEVILELSKHYEIFIASAAMEHPNSFLAKYEWLKEHFPFLSDKNFVFCGDKSIVNADYLIDDSIRQLTNFRGQGILFSAPHNIHETSFTRVHHWKEVREVFLSDQRLKEV